jgi:uncharacterized protein with ATP-grasp and redox domains
VRQALAASRLVTTDAEVQERVLREVLSATSRMDMTQSPPRMAQHIHGIISAAIGNEDPYRNMKRRFTEFALRLLPALHERVRRAQDPFSVAVRLAIAGNVIDVGANPGVTETHVREAIEWALRAPLDREVLEHLRSSVDKATSILYLADNAGEIVFDRLVLGVLPKDRVVLAVRGAPSLNDATLEDAEAAGLTDRMEVLDNGSSAPGTILDDCAESFRRRFSAADVIIAKGQGNYESLNDADRGVHFLFKAKCELVARDLGCEVGEMVVAKTPYP